MEASRAVGSTGHKKASRPDAPSLPRSRMLSAVSTEAMQGCFVLDLGIPAADWVQPATAFQALAETSYDHSSSMVRRI